MNRKFYSEKSATLSQEVKKPTLLNIHQTDVIFGCRSAIFKNNLCIIRQQTITLTTIISDTTNEIIIYNNTISSGSGEVSPSNIADDVNYDTARVTSEQIKAIKAGTSYKDIIASLLMKSSSITIP